MDEQNKHISVIRLPELGENITSGLVVQVYVSSGDVITKDQPLLELETDKAVMDFPSPVAGTIIDVLVKAEQEVQIGQELFTYSPSESPLSHPENTEENSRSRDSEREKVEENLDSVEKGSEPKTASAQKGKHASETRGQADYPLSKESMEAMNIPSAKKLVPASPSTRRFAREIGVDITTVQGTGPGGRITIDDVKAHARTQAASAIPATEKRTRGIPAEASSVLPDFQQWGAVERVPLRPLRLTAIRTLTEAWRTIPHVTHFDRARIDHVESFRKKMNRQWQRNPKLTMTAILVKIVALALQRFPSFNASIDLVKQELVLKKYYHLGVAVDTSRGLLVPVIRNVDHKGLRAIAEELASLAEKARSKKLALEEMQGGTFTISNLGGIGGQGFTPIINYPEVAILGVGRAGYQPVFKEGAFEPQFMLPLMLSYDHRVIDGADAARFLRWIANALEEPLSILLNTE